MDSTRWLAVARTQWLAWLALLACTAMAGTALAAPGDVWTAHARGIIEVAADGTVQSYTVEQSVGAKVDAALKQHVSGWRFEPVIENGQAIPVRARAEMVLKATIGADGNSAEMAVEKADFYELLADSNRLLLHEGVRIPPPRYPPAAAQAGVAADVAMVVTVDGTGRVVGAEVERIDLRSEVERAPKAAATYAREFQSVVRRVVSRWQLNPKALQYEGGLARTRVPVAFQLEGMTWARRQTVVEPKPLADGPAIANMSASGDIASPRLVLQHELGVFTEG
ncbi:energy transducer TonB [Pseudoxanthomonas suwonensis]|uniref:energy transducer TonB n=1 Tax=Pseudoxanthomonas suwonensis TaxID=314722 RepID=UPI00048AAC94|nr:hypothetical protein [Pseudoxanthomonas suwonensis]